MGGNENTKKSENFSIFTKTLEKPKIKERLIRKV